MRSRKMLWLVMSTSLAISSAATAQEQQDGTEPIINFKLHLRDDVLKDFLEETIDRTQAKELKEQLEAAPDDELMKPSLRIFQPKARLYFDVGSQDANELDIFRDGSLAPSLNFVEVVVPLFYINEDKDWIFALSFGLGMNLPAGGSEDGSLDGSDVPVLLGTVGIVLEFPLAGQPALKRVKEEFEDFKGKSFDVKKWRRGASLGIEFGVAYGISPDENLSNADDTGIYVGLTLHVPF